MPSAFKNHLLLSACAVLLLGCGGSDDPPPPSATASADAYTLDWNAAQRLAVQDNDVSSHGTPVLSIVEQPANGSVAVDGAALVYTPKTGYFGEDALRYKLVNGSASSEAAVSLKVEARLTLEGQVVDAPIANAKVVATLGTQSFSADADAQGRYSLALRSTRPADFLSLTATGVGSQSAVVLSSLAGELSGLAKQAKGGKLASEQWPALQITHLSSALAGLLTQAGPLPATDLALAAAAQKLNAEDLLDAAALVKLVVDGGVALPVGVSNTKELLATATAMSGFAGTQRRNNASQFEALRQGLLGDAMLQRAPPLPQAAGAAPVSLLYAYGLGGAVKQALQISLQANGSAQVVADAVRAASWVLDGKLLRVQLTVPHVVSGFSDSADASGQQWPTDYVNTGYTLSDLGAGNGRYTLATVKQEGYMQVHGGPKAEIKQFDEGPGSAMRRYEAGALESFKAEDMAVGTRWAGPYSTHSSNQLVFKQDILKITGADSAVMERGQVTASWKLIDGALALSLPDSNYRYRRLGVGPLGEERWLMEHRVGDVLLGLSEIMAVRAGVVSVDAAQLARRWEGNINAHARSPAFYLLRADGMQAVTAVAENGVESTPVFSRYWDVLPDGRVEIDAGRTRVGNALCNPSAADTACTMTQRRFWLFAARSGKTLFAIEQGPYFGPTDEASMSYRFVAFTDVGEVK